MMDVHSYDMDGNDLGTTFCQIALAHYSGDGGVLSAEYAVNDEFGFAAFESDPESLRDAVAE